MAQCDLIGFDTEFVSEDCYRPELCLIQVAAGDLLAVIDPYACEDTTPFWNLLCDGSATVVAHAAREEIRFAYRFTAKPISNLFDTQLTAGFVGIEYPASLGTLVQRLVGESLPKGETRTDWRRRPLSNDQIRYALTDVTNLERMHRDLIDRIRQRDRESWLQEETDRLQDKVIQAETQERWQRVSGSSGLKPRQMEILRHIWRWRESVAQQRDRIPKRILRDDLMVELAKRGSSDVSKVRGIRGMERRGLQQHHEDIAAAIQAAWQVDDANLP
ncbi:MAG: ribonuclease D, partial [Planctomycetota bacterium]